MRVSVGGVAYGFAIVLVAGVVGSVTAALGVPAALTTTLLAALLLARAAAKSPDNAVTAAVSTTMSIGFAYAFSADFELWMPLATSRFYGVQFESYPFNLVILVFLAAVLAYPAAFVVRLLRRAALPVAIALTLATTLFAALGLRSFARPQPDDYTKLFATTRLEAGGTAVAGAVTFAYDRHCVATANGVEIVGDPEVMPPLVLDCSPLTVRVDPGADAILVFAKGREPPIAMFRMNGQKLEEIRISDFRRRLGVPRGWVFAALASIAVACAAIAMALRARRPIRGVEGEHEGLGWVRARGAPRFAAELVSHAPGPVVVVDDATAHPTYRDDGAAKSFTVKPGTLAALREEQRARVETWACVAIASSIMGLVPLWIAHAHGLL